MKSFLPIILVLLCVLGAVPARAQTKTMVVTTVSSGPVPIEVSTHTRISFSDDLSRMTVSSADTDKPIAFDIDDIDNIIFTLDSSVDKIAVDGSDLRISNQGGIVTLSADSDIKYAAWDAAGTLVLSGEGESTVTLDFTTRTRGIYIIRANDTTFKFINR